MRRRDGDPKYPLLKTLPKEPFAVRMKLSWFKISALGWVRGNAAHAAYRFLTTPRPWVRRLGDCVMQSGSLERHR